MELFILMNNIGQILQWEKNYKNGEIEDIIELYNHVLSEKIF